MTKPARMQAGGLSRTGRQQMLLLLIVVAAIWRVLPLMRIVQDPAAVSGALGEDRYVRPFVGSNFNLLEFLVNPAISWVGSPIYLFLAALETQIGTGGGWLLAMQTLLSIALVVGIFLVGEKLLGSAPALMAAFAFAVLEPAITMGFILAPMALLALLSLWTARYSWELARQKELGHGLPFGARLGFLTLVQGYAALWLPALMAWLPFCSRRFRQKSAWKFFALVGAGFLLVLLPVLLHGVLVGRDFVLPWENAAYDLRRAAESGRLYHSEDPEQLDYPLAQRAQALHQHEQRHAGARASASARWAEDLGAAWSSTGITPTLFLRRFAAATAGAAAWPEAAAAQPPSLLQGLPTLRVEWILPFTLLGVIALLASAIHFAPLYFGLAIPLLVAGATGVDATTQSVMVPFQVLFAGYGVARAWASRRWLAAWLIVPCVLAFGAWWVITF